MQNNNKDSIEIEFWDVPSLLGEGPVWHAGRKSLFWVDIEGRELHEKRHPGNKIISLTFPQRIGAIAIQDNESMILALQDHIILYNLETQKAFLVCDLEIDTPTNRTNDGKCDPQGRLWQGTMDVNCEPGKGALYCIEDGKPPRKMLSGLTISNGMAWSPDGQWFYFIDSPTYRIECFRFDAETGNIAFERTAVQVPTTMGMPDGMTIDREGMLWVAHWGDGTLRRWDPNTGNMKESIVFAAPQITSCTFGGDNYDELFVTSARTGLSAEMLEQYPQSGFLFRVKLPVGGFAPYRFREKRGEI